MCAKKGGVAKKMANFTDGAALDVGCQYVEREDMCVLVVYGLATAAVTAATSSSPTEVPSSFSNQVYQTAVLSVITVIGTLILVCLRRLMKRTGEYLDRRVDTLIRNYMTSSASGTAGASISQDTAALPESPLIAVPASPLIVLESDRRVHPIDEDGDDETEMQRQVSHVFERGSDGH